MKPILMSILLILALVSCQKEFVDIREPDKSVTITADDPVADLILKVVLKDGSYDNIIDRCSEISIKFPYSILIEDQTYTIDSQEDIDIIKLDHFFERDDIEIVYPITISYRDYSEETLTNEDELDEIQELYNTELSDDDIECLDFIYPIEIALYNAVKQITDVVTVDNDAEMHNIFEDIDELFVEISYPIELELLSGEKISVVNNFQLEDEISQIIDSCDEEDEVEFSEEDYPYVDLLARGEWSVSFYADTSNETSVFSGYTFNFSSDFTVQANTMAVTISGLWELDVTTDLTILEIDFDTEETHLAWLNDEWKITSAKADRIELEAESDFDGYIKTLHLAKSVKK